MSSTLSALYHATSSGKCRVCVTSLFHLHGVCAGTDAGLPVEIHFCMFKNGLLISQQVAVIDEFCVEDSSIKNNIFCGENAWTQHHICGKGVTLINDLLIATHQWSTNS